LKDLPGRVTEVKNAILTKPWDGAINKEELKQNEEL
jgi:hypothetical protein